MFASLNQTLFWLWQGVILCGGVVEHYIQCAARDDAARISLPLLPITVWVQDQTGLLHHLHRWPGIWYVPPPPRYTQSKSWKQTNKQMQLCSMAHCCFTVSWVMSCPCSGQALFLSIPWSKTNPNQSIPFCPTFLDCLVSFGIYTYICHPFTHIIITSPAVFWFCFFHMTGLCCPHGTFWSKHDGRWMLCKQATHNLLVVVVVVVLFFSLGPTCTTHFGSRLSSSAWRSSLCTLSSTKCVIAPTELPQTSSTLAFACSLC